MNEIQVRTFYYESAIVGTLLSAGWNQIFKKGSLDRTSTFRGGLLGKRGVTFFRAGVQLSHNKLKSEIFDDKKSL